ncbi:MAG: replication-associated recombination protein A [Phycisphaerales bacterium]
MEDLWSDQRTGHRDAARPLAARLRPRTLDEVVGQTALVGQGTLLRRLVAADRLTSIILAGPPGTGKTTIAEVIAAETGRRFERAHAAMVGVKDIRQILQGALARVETGGPGTILFLDEIHRFSRSQQDVLLHDVERGVIVLIGATTENPWFMVNPALVSRSTVFMLESLDADALSDLIRRAAADPRAFPGRTVTLDDEAVDLWAVRAGGDARRALTALEVAVVSSPGASVHITADLAAESIQSKALRHGGNPDEHYDLASAFIKSMRAGDEDGTLHWLARMLEGGEDPRFLARRIAIFAAEDVGVADPSAASLAAATWQIVERTGMPESRISLAHAAMHMCRAPKSREMIESIDAALSAVRSGATREIPMHLRDRNSSVRRAADAAKSST